MVDMRLALDVPRYQYHHIGSEAPALRIHARGRFTGKDRHIGVYWYHDALRAVVFSVVTNTQPASRRPSSQAANRPSSACVLPQRAVATSSKSLLDSIRSIRESWESGRHACARSKRADAPVSHFSQVYEYPTAQSQHQFPDPGTIEEKLFDAPTAVQQILNSFTCTPQKNSTEDYSYEFPMRPLPQNEANAAKAATNNFIAEDSERLKSELYTRQRCGPLFLEDYVEPQRVGLCCCSWCVARPCTGVSAC